ncbi:hypothetical protein ACWY4P_15310 [Streptomyces sp. LZ34]
MEKHMGVFDWFRRAARGHGEAEASAGEGIGIPKQQSKQEADAAREAVRHPEQETAPEAVGKPSGGADNETGESART